jgi:hypothetical protein
MTKSLDELKKKAYAVLKGGVHTIMPEGSHRASIFALQNLPHKNPQRKVTHSEN